MMLAPAGVNVHIAAGVTDMRNYAVLHISARDLIRLAMHVQKGLLEDPFCGHLLVFRGRKANLIKILFWDGTGLCLFTKSLEQGHFKWSTSNAVDKTVRLCQARRHDDETGRSI